MVRAGIWNGIRSAFHNAALAPATALDLVEAAIPVEDNDDALTWVLPWARRDAAALSDDPSAALGRVHRASLARLDTADPGSTVQLAAFQSTISTATDATVLRAWLDGSDVPAGAAVDLDLRWRILIRLATMGEIGRSELRRRPGRRAHGSVTGGARLRGGLAAGRRGEGLGLGSVPRRRGRPQLRGGGQRDRHVAGRPRAPHGTLRRPLLR